MSRHIISCTMYITIGNMTEVVEDVLEYGGGGVVGKGGSIHAQKL